MTNQAHDVGYTHAELVGAEIEMNNYTLNLVGQVAVKSFIEESIKDMRPMIPYAFFSQAELAADLAFDDGGGAVIEIPGHKSKTGNPVTLNCKREWFDATPDELG